MNLLSMIRTLAAASLLAFCVAGARAEQKETFDPYSASIEENIRVPEVPKKLSQAVQSAMAQLEKTFRDGAYATDRVRNGEVLMLTIPASKLFSPNSTVLKKDAARQLLPLLPYIKRRDKYKVIVAVHSDDTGDATYSDRLTEERASAIDDFYSRQEGMGETGIIPYGLGADEPVASNTGVKNREANRRVEFYFIPTQNLINKSKR